MVSAVASGLYYALRNALDGKVSNFGSPPTPAVFQDIAPTTAVLPYVVYNDVAGVPWDSHDRMGLRQRIDVKVYAARTGSSKALNDILDTVMAAMHNRRFVVEGRNFVSCRVISGPLALPIEENNIGKAVTLEVITQGG